MEEEKKFKTLVSFKYILGTEYTGKGGVRIAKGDTVRIKFIIIAVACSVYWRFANYRVGVCLKSI